MMQPQSRDARLLAALAFLTLLFPGWGGVVSLLIWLTQRRDLPYAAFHAAQATVVHLLVSAVFGLVVPLVLFLGWTLGGRPPIELRTLAAVGFGVFGAVALVGVAGATAAWRPGGVRLPLIARIVGS